MMPLMVNSHSDKITLEIKLCRRANIEGFLIPFKHPMSPNNKNRFSINQEEGGQPFNHVKVCKTSKNVREVN